MNGDYTILLVCLKVTCQSKGRHKFTFDCIVRASFDPSQAVSDEAVGPYYWFEFFLGVKYVIARMPFVLATFA